MVKERAKIKQSIKDSLDAIDRLHNASTEEFVNIINELRRRVILTIVEDGELNAATAEAVKLRIDSILSDYKEKFKSNLSENQRRLFVKGVQLVDNTVKAGALHPNVPYLSEQKLDVLKRYGAESITGLTDFARSKISQEIDLAVLGQKPTTEVIEAIGRNLDSPSVFGTLAKRAEVIVRTDINRIQQIATSDRMKQVSKTIVDLRKEWVHGHVGIPRPGHLALHGRTVAADGKFELVSATGVVYFVDGPMDPLLPVGEIANCRCKAVPVVARFLNN